ncbi:MAG TPA: DUF4062 domain-containing protein [Chitinophagaceae bacterium]|nr:DUF4062 domain-containing protein [Chitinophagaceae bacterium]
MSLKIFISSVSEEFEEERAILNEEINKLQDLFIGMEFFGSDPAKPADYCREMAEQCDLYIGLIGLNEGSIDKESGLSFTRIEYDTAFNKNKPCLIYFKGSKPVKRFKITTVESGYEKFKSLLLEKHTVYYFKDVTDLRVRFLNDFIKLLRAGLFHKILPLRQGPIAAEVLHSLMKGSIHEQIKAVGQEKYIPELFILREAEKEILDFTHFDEDYFSRLNFVIEKLQTISHQYNLDKATALFFEKAKKELANFNTTSVKSIINELKEAFYFNEVASLVGAFEKLITDPAETGNFYKISELKFHLKQQPFIVQSKLANFEDAFSDIAKRISVAKRTFRSFTEFIELFPSYIDESGRQAEAKLANDLLLELSILTDLYAKRCLVLVGKAGSGKTNNLCHLAEVLIENHPVILLSGQMEISNEYDIQYHIQQRLEQEFSGFFSDWMHRINESLHVKGKWLFILIDGINETNNLPLMLRLFNQLLPRIENKKIKLIISCRDLSWDRFRDAYAPYLFKDVVSLKEFTDKEWRNVVKLYFNKFKIECIVEKESIAALRNPLLLRFFCEANQGKKLGKLRSLKLVSIFDHYLERINQSISRRHSLFSAHSATLLLLAIAHIMWEKKFISINADFLNSLPGDPGNNQLLQNLVLSENIILEIAKHPSSLRKSTRFLYDEFMEYMIAKSWVEEVVNADDIQQKTGELIGAAIESIDNFQPAFGAIFFFDQMMAFNGTLINKMIIKMSGQGKQFQDTQMVYAIENLNLDELNDELIEIVKKFDSQVRNDLKDRLSQVILKILKKQPHLEFGKKYINKILEVGDNSVDKEKLKNKKELIYEADKDSLPLLPPARYHYSIDTKLTAISMLVLSKDNLNNKTIEDGIKRMGNMDLAAALQSLKNLDGGTEQLVYKTITDYIELKLPEYRIYSAWLLRERYGSKPAEFIIRLLMDNETRVHQYVFGLFNTRLIESELIDQMLSKIKSAPEIKPWHLRYFVRLLGKNTQFHQSKSAEHSRSGIISVLEKLQNHQKASIRLEAYRAIMQYPGYFDPLILRKRMSDDYDNYIRSCGTKYFPAE